MDQDKTSSFRRNFARDLTYDDSAQMQLNTNEIGKNTAEDQFVRRKSVRFSDQDGQQETGRLKKRNFYPTWKPIDQSRQMSSVTGMDASSGLEQSVDDYSYATAPSFNAEREGSYNVPDPSFRGHASIKDQNWENSANESFFSVDTSFNTSSLTKAKESVPSKSSIPRWNIPESNKQADSAASGMQIQRDTNEQDLGAPLSNFPVQPKGRTDIDEIFKKRSIKRSTSLPNRARQHETRRGQTNRADDSAPSTDEKSILNASFPGTLPGKKRSFHGNFFNLPLETMWKVPKEQTITRSAKGHRATELLEIKSSRPTVESHAAQKTYAETSFSTPEAKRTIRPTSLAVKKKYCAKKIPLSSSRTTDDPLSRKENIILSHCRRENRPQEDEGHKYRKYEERNRLVEQQDDRSKSRTLPRRREDRREIRPQEDEGHKYRKYEEKNRSVEQQDNRSKSRTLPRRRDDSTNVKEQSKIKRREPSEEVRKITWESVSPKKRTKRDIRRSSSPVPTISRQEHDENLAKILRERMASEGLDMSAILPSSDNQKMRDIYSYIEQIDPSLFTNTSSKMRSSRHPLLVKGKPEDDEPMSSHRPLLDYDAKDTEEIRAGRREAARDFMKGKKNRVPSPHSSDEDLPPFPTNLSYEYETPRGRIQSRKGDDLPFEEESYENSVDSAPLLSESTKQTHGRRKRTEKTRREKFIESLHLPAQALDPIVEEQNRTPPKPGSRESQEYRPTNSYDRKTRSIREYSLGEGTAEISEDLYDVISYDALPSFDRYINAENGAVCPHCKLAGKKCTCVKPKLRFHEVISDVKQADVHAEADTRPKQLQGEQEQLIGDGADRQRKNDGKSRKWKKSAAKQTRRKPVPANPGTSHAVNQEGKSAKTQPKQPKVASTVAESTTIDTSGTSLNLNNVTWPSMTPPTRTPSGTAINFGSVPSIKSQCKCWFDVCCCGCIWKSEPFQKFKREYCDDTFLCCWCPALLFMIGGIVSIVILILMNDKYLLIPASSCFVLAAIFGLLAYYFYRKGRSCCYPD